MKKTPIVLFLIPMLFGACSHYSQDDGERLANEVYALQSQMTTVQQTLAEMQRFEDEQEKKLREILKEVSTLSKAARRNDADLGVQMEIMLQDMARAKGRVESFSERMSTFESGISKVQEELDLRFQNLADEAKIREAETEAEKSRAIELARKRERILGDPKQLFREVDRLIGAQQPQNARKLLREFMIKTKGKKRARKNRARAQYLIGETYFAAGEYQQAASEFNTVRKDHAKYSKAHGALATFKIGRCLENLKLPDDAKHFYQLVLEEYGRTRVAKDARKRLKVLR